MTAATITTKPEGYVNEDKKVLTLSDGETYISGFNKPLGAHLSLAEAHGGGAGSAINLSYALSGNTFTITYKLDGTGVTDKKVEIEVFGKK